MRRAFVLILLATALTVMSPSASFAMGEKEETAVKRIVLIGATARSGREIIRQGLEQNYEIVGLARSPHKITTEHPNLTMVKGDVRDQATLEAAMSGDEVVVSVFGFPTPDNPMAEIGEVDLYTVGVRNLLAAMKAKGNTRLIYTSSTGVERRNPNPIKPGPEASMAEMWHWNARHLYTDMAESEEMVFDSGVEAIVLRPGFMVEEPARGDMKITTQGDTPESRIITYADFAAFILQQTDSDEYIGEALGMFSDTKLQFGVNVDFEAEVEKAKNRKTQ